MRIPATRWSTRRLHRGWVAPFVSALGDADALADGDAEVLGAGEGLGVGAGEGDVVWRSLGRTPSRAIPEATGIEAAAMTRNADATIGTRGRARTQAWYGCGQVPGDRQPFASMAASASIC